MPLHDASENRDRNSTWPLQRMLASKERKFSGHFMLHECITLREIQGRLKQVLLSVDLIESSKDQLINGIQR